MRTSITKMVDAINKKKITIFLLSSLFFFFFAIFPTFATDISVPLEIPILGHGEITTCAGGSCTGIGDYVKIIYQWLVGLAAVLAVVAFTYGGVLWLVAGGEAGRVNESKKIMGNALVGLILALLSYSLLYVVSPQLVQLQPIRVPGIAPIQLKLKVIEYEEPSYTARSTMSMNNTTYDSLFKKYGDTNGIDCTLLKAIAYQESGFDASLPANSKGAVGLMQVQIGSGRPSEEELKDPEENVAAAVSILQDAVKNGCPSHCTKPRSAPGCSPCTLPSDMTSALNGDSSGFTPGVATVLAAYNAGSCGANIESLSCGNQCRWQCHGEVTETEQYVPAVFGHYKKMKDNGWGC